MKTIRTFKDKKTGLQMATVSFNIPFEVADKIEAVAKIGGTPADYLATYALRSYMGAAIEDDAFGEPTDDEKRAYGFEVEQVAAAG